MKHVIIMSILYATLFGVDINGKWQLSSKHPINFNGIACHSPKIEFKNDGSFHIIRKNSTNTSMTGTSHFYTLNGNKMNVFLKNKKSNGLFNFLLKHSSTSQTFILTKKDDNCFLASDTKLSGNKFFMCKIN